MTIEQKEKNYILNKKLECARSMLLIIKNDINNNSGAVTEDVLLNAINGVIEYIEYVRHDIEM